jgi:hypothetical protein
VSEAISDAALRNLLQDCLALWGIAGSVEAGSDGLEIVTASTRCGIRHGPLPTRWFLTTPARTRPAPSITALLTGLRNALGAAPAARAWIGGGAARS